MGSNGLGKALKLGGSNKERKAQDTVHTPAISQADRTVLLHSKCREMNRAWKAPVGWRCAQLAECLPSMLGVLNPYPQPGVVPHACNTNTHEARGSETQSHSQLPIEFDTRVPQTHNSVDSPCLGGSFPAHLIKYKEGKLDVLWSPITFSRSCPIKQ